ncbi:MAG: hypothetical protein KIG82_05485, partial [Prevotella sp.]|nr:hypothetical protein [Prevotella sp.]
IFNNYAPKRGKGVQSAEIWIAIIHRKQHHFLKKSTQIASFYIIIITFALNMRAHKKNIVA